MTRSPASSRRGCRPSQRLAGLSLPCITLGPAAALQTLDASVTAPAAAAVAQQHIDAECPPHQLRPAVVRPPRSAVRAQLDRGIDRSGLDSSAPEPSLDSRAMRSGSSPPRAPTGSWHVTQSRRHYRHLQDPGSSPPPSSAVARPASRCCYAAPPWQPTPGRQEGMSRCIPDAAVLDREQPTHYPNCVPSGFLDKLGGIAPTSW